MLDTEVSEAVTAAAATDEDGPEPAVRGVQLMSSTTQIGTLTLSREFDEIVAAMGEIQFAVNQAGLIADAKNDVLQNAYAPLPVILKCLSPHLKSHGVTLLQPFEVKDRTICVKTADLVGLNAAESQVQAFKLCDAERKTLVKAIHDRKTELSEAA